MGDLTLSNRHGTIASGTIGVTRLQGQHSLLRLAGFPPLPASQIIEAATSLERGSSTTPRSPACGGWLITEVIWTKKSRAKISKSRVSYIPESLDICSLSNHGTRASSRSLRIAWHIRLERINARKTSDKRHVARKKRTFQEG